MLHLRSWIRSFFGFSRSQTNGFLVLLPLMVVIIFSEPVYRSFFFSREGDSSHDKLKLDSLIAQWSTKEEKSLPDENQQPRKIMIERHAFNPNKVSEQELVALGFSEKLSNRIINYRKKGGVFKVKSDLMKIYGMDSSFYSGLHHLISLPEKQIRTAVVFEKKREFKTDLKPKITEKFDLNHADTAQLKALRGIGDKLAQRIIKYRDGLGGFISAEQIKEVYGLDSIVVNTLIANSYISSDFVSRKIDVNNASTEILSAHPYLSRKAAEAMVTYRFQHGKFHTLEDLGKIRILAPETIQKIAPYLEFKN